jgi:hypothetical protein
MRQEMADHEREIIERNASRAAQSANNSALLLRGFLGLSARPAAMVLAAPRLAFAPFADSLGAPVKVLGHNAGGLGRAGNLNPNGRGGAGSRMNGEHHVLLR